MSLLNAGSWITSVLLCHMVNPRLLQLEESSDVRFPYNKEDYFACSPERMNCSYDLHNDFNFPREGAPNFGNSKTTTDDIRL
jgi:hypothetical protein